MAGTGTGGLKAAATNKAKHGEDFYVRMGRIGGMMGHTGGFASNPERARCAGAKGGRLEKEGQPKSIIMIWRRKKMQERGYIDN